MSYNYKLDELEANELGSSNGIDTAVYLPDNPVMGNAGGLNLKEAVDRLYESKIVLGGAKSSKFISAHNCTPENKPHIIPTLPLLTANELNNQYNVTLIKSQYLYAVKPSDVNSIIKEGAKDKNYAILYNKRPIISSDNYRPMNVQCGANCNRIPYCEIDRNGNYFIWLQRVPNPTTDQSPMDIDTKQWMIDDINLFANNNYYFIAECNKKGSFLFRGAAALVNIVDVLDGDRKVNATFESRSDHWSFLTTATINLILVDVFYTSTFDSTWGW